MAKIITSVKRAFDILDLFFEDTQSLSKPEIAARLRLPRTTVHEQVQTLLASGYLEKDENLPNRFTLGFRVFELGSIFASRLDPSQECLRVAKEVSKACDETVQMAIRDGRDVVFIIRVDSSRILRLVSAVGSRLPAHCTAVGKMLLSALSDQELAGLYQKQRRLLRMTSNSITSVKRLIEEISEIRKRGYAYDDCESNEDARCVAAPVYDHDGNTYAAMSITVPATRMDLKRKIELSEAVQVGAKKLSRRLGYGFNRVIEGSAAT
ncbi:MAG: IclR family transcriptional regulator [Deltaproteobacteria bacterium]|nr:IclR family transcriptional regulator [Deltaproteobacteria bacterium]